MFLISTHILGFRKELMDLLYNGFLLPGARKVVIKLYFVGNLPPAVEDYDEANSIKTVTEYKYNDDGKMTKVLYNVMMNRFLNT